MCCSGAMAKCLMLLPRFGRREREWCREWSLEYTQEASRRDQHRRRLSLQHTGFRKQQGGDTFCCEVMAAEGFPSQMILVTWKKVWL